MVLCSTPVALTDSEFQEMYAQIEANQGKGVVAICAGWAGQILPRKEKCVDFHTQTN